MKTSLFITLIATLALFLSGCAAGAPKGSAVDMTGTWQFDVVSPGGSGSPTFELQQEGATLTGTYTGAFGQAPLTGVVQDKAFELRFISMGAEIVYTGHVDGNSVEGEVDFGGQGEGTFKGRKQ